MEQNQSEQKKWWRAGWKNVDWPTALFLILTPLATAILLPIYFQFQSVEWPIVALAVFMYLAGTVSITAGYHRMYSHRSFQARGIVEVLFLFFGAGAFQGSVLKWATDHRIHHREVDTDQDPYSINKGFWYAHIGWLLLKDEEKYRDQFAEDLKRNKLVALQHRFYIPLAIIAGFAFPTAVGALLGNAFGGFLFAGLLRLVLSHHATFLINSACHVWGRQPYSDSHSARDSVVMAVLTSGEGYHNFHHQFEVDYRNGVRWYQYDPTKWLVRSLWLFGLTYKLRKVPNSELLKYRLRAQEKRLQLTGACREKLENLRHSVENAQKRLKELKDEYRLMKKNFHDQSQERLIHLKAELRLAKIEFSKNMELWQAYVRTMQAMPAPVYINNKYRR